MVAGREKKIGAEEKRRGRGGGAAGSASPRGRKETRELNARYYQSSGPDTNN
jgi:hypothetical protein